MREDKHQYLNIKYQQQIGELSLQQQNSRAIILKYIQPPRQLLKSNNRANCFYKKQLNNLPSIFKCCQELHPLAENYNTIQYAINLNVIKNIYKRNIQLKVNPFKTTHYTDSKKDNHLKKQQSQSTIFDNQNLLFDSHFQSGNLLSVDKEIGKNCYHLMMQNDINTFGCTQWFFFRVTNKDQTKATFFINNFYKPHSLYQIGMKILIFSMKKFMNEGVGWVRGGQEIAYFRNTITERKQNGDLKQFYSLKFVYHFQFEKDEVYFAYNYPYTYSRLNSFLIEKDKAMISNVCYNCRTLCRTVAENKIFLITITDNSVEKTKKKSIFITSRVHPGQTVSSLMMQGIINFLSSNDPIALILRSRFIFKLIPMLNPDGVIHGNYRTNLAGIDLNRVWDLTDSVLSPQIYQLKKHIKQFNKQCPIIMFCDLHGHSERKNAFIYGCQNEKIKQQNRKHRHSYSNSTHSEQSRLFPFMLSFLNENFIYKSCNFTVQKNKKGTARVQLWKQYKIPNIFTLQVSFCSSEYSQYHFRPTDYSNIGIAFCQNIYEYFLNYEKRKQYSNKLKNNVEYHLEKKLYDDDSQSDTDLLDKKMLNQLRNGFSSEVWKCRQLIIPKLAIKQNNQESKELKVLSIKRYLSTEPKKQKQRESQTKQINCQISSINSKKAIILPIPTKKLTLDTQMLKERKQIKNIYLTNSVSQKNQFNYQGKNSIYRIQRKNIKMSKIESQLKKSIIFRGQTSFNVDVF